MAGVIPLNIQKYLIENNKTVDKGTTYAKELPTFGLGRMLTLTVTISASTGTAAPTYVNDAPYKLLKRIRIETDNGKVFYEVSGQELKYLNVFDFGRVVEEGALPTAASSSGSITFTLKIPLAVLKDPDAELVTLVPAYAITGWRIKIDLGTESDIVASGSATIESIVIDALVYEYYDDEKIDKTQFAESVFVVRRVENYDDITSVGERTLKFNTPSVVRRFVLYAYDSSNALSDSVVSKFAVYVDDDRIYENTWKANKQGDVLEYSLQTVPTGTTAVDFGTKDITACIEATNSLRIEYVAEATGKFVAVNENLVKFVDFIKA